ncbi:cytochrome P450 [Favolaschia claudopus]|uniref:Cytochrome P450 n=1 Tax=Favolaschia claudopus TaxID=2862362 RepID=A0AAV9ZR84_9AGAR
MFSPDVTPSSPSLMLAVFTAALSALWLASHLRAKSPLPLPPGPRKWPLVGNLFSLTSRPWECCMQWSKEYGSDIVYLDLAGTSVIILSSLSATEALLAKRSAIYSDRAPASMAGDLMGWNFLFLLMNYGDEWRTHRRLFTQQINLDKTKRELRACERVAAHSLLRRLFEGPKEYRSHLNRFAGEIMISLAYGADAAAVDEAPYIHLAEQAVKSIASALVPGRFLVDVFPVLRYVPEWFPGAQFQTIARKGKKLAEKTRDVPFTDTKRKMKEGTAQSCFTVNALQQLDSSCDNFKSSSSSYYNETTVKNVASIMYIAGVDTITTTLTVFVLAMVLHPHVLKKAQGEVDGLVKHKGELPDFDDEEALPYVSAVVREVLRWRPAGPIGIPHRLSKDDSYQGYHLPAGSLVIGNIWAILRDDKLYGSDTEAFIPERFLLVNGALNKVIPHPETILFGFGRRVCPGRHIAMSVIWIAIVSMLATLDISRSTDETQEGEEPHEMAFEGVIMFAPLPFKCSIVPRSKEAVELVRATSGSEH